MVTIHYPSAGGGDWLPAAFLIYLVVWLLVLGHALARNDFDPVTRLTWVLVVILVPVAGIFLYVLLSPTRPASRPRDKSNPLAGTPWENNPGHVRDQGE